MTDGNDLNYDLDDKGDLYRALSIITQLYTDKTHLVYELLQNAEDTEAKDVKFIMFNDRLEFWHDGKPFTESNLKSIRRVALSDKLNVNAIGKFGVGFKSVFSICETVKLYSEPDNYINQSVNDEPFLDKFAYQGINFFRDLKKIDFDRSIKPYTTCFVFPFCVDKNFSGYKTKESLHKALEERLRKLGADVMLFLKHIQDITYEIKDTNDNNTDEGVFRLHRDNLGSDCYKIKTVSIKNLIPKDYSTFIGYSKNYSGTKTIDIVFLIENLVAVTAARPHPLGTPAPVKAVKKYMGPVNSMAELKEAIATNPDVKRMLEIEIQDLKRYRADKKREARAKGVEPPSFSRSPGAQARINLLWKMAKVKEYKDPVKEELGAVSAANMDSKEFEEMWPKLTREARRELVRQVSGADIIMEKHSPAAGTVERAMDYSDDDNNPKFISAERKHGFISVYFPTGTESKLKFIVQAPFATTPNRESVPLDENKELVQLTAELLKEAVLDIKNRGWLSLEFLTLLPFSLPNENWLFEPLYKATINLLKNEAILPTKDGGYTNRKTAKIVRSAKLIEIFNDKELTLLLGQESKWMPSESKNGKFTETDNLFGDFNKFLKNKEKGIGVDEIDPGKLPDLVKTNPDFVKSVDDSWLEKFYNYLASEQKTMLGKNHAFSTIEFIKTMDETFVSAYRQSENIQVPNVYKKPDETSEIKEPGKIIADFIQNNCADFVARMDFANYDDYAEYEYFKKSLESNANSKPSDNHIAIKNRLWLVKKAVRFLKINKPDDIDKLDDIEKICTKCLFLKVLNYNGISCDRKCSSSNIYREKDINGVSLKDYFSGINLEVQDVYVLNEEYYRNEGLTDDDLKLLEKIGVKNNIYSGIDNDIWKGSDGKTTCTNIGNFRKNLNFEYIKGILDYISNNSNCELSKQKSGIIFSLLKNVKPKLCGKWQYGATHPKTLQGSANIINILSVNNWLFTNNGDLVKSSTISHFDLDISIYGEVDKYSELYDILGFIKDPIETLFLKFRSAVSHFSENEIQKLISHFEKDAENNIFDPDKNAKAFPEEPVKDLGRLKSATKNNYDNAPSVEYEIFPRSIRTSWINPRDNLERYKGYCQMCETQRLYWEITEIFLEPKKEIVQMNLSLCPSCAANYRRLRNATHIMDEFRRNILNIDIAAAFENKTGTLSVVVERDTRIRFTATHLAEIQEFLRHWAGLPKKIDGKPP
ncbi:MAG: hypothetical protein Pg6A_00740 [Termitinemataceae bacterium]|nr:MAG: hypothetical protein Pg6A_00740 [Termitinemataceae bacterium]